MEQQNPPEMDDPQQEISKSQPPKRKAFEKCQKLYVSIGITPSLANQSYPLNDTILFGLLGAFSGIFCTSVFIIYDTESFVEYTQSVCVCSTEILMAFTMLIVVVKVKKLFKLINDGDNLVNATLKYSASESIFKETIRIGQKLSEIVFVFIIKMTPACVYLSLLFYTYFIYFTTDLGDEVFQLPVSAWLPFDWKNPLGFFVAMAMQYAVVSYAAIIGASTLTLGCVTFLYVIASSKCIKESLRSIGQCTNENSLEQFIEFIQFNSIVKQLVNDFSDIFQHVITMLIIWSFVIICGALLLIPILSLHDSDDFVVLLIIMTENIYAFGALIIACEVGERVYLEFDECNDLINQFEWYLFPAGIQRMLPFIMHFTQRPVKIICFGSIAADRGTFKYVMINAFKYFMVLRKFYD